MAYCTDRTEDVYTCMSNYSCHTCPYWSINVKKKKAEEEAKKAEAEEEARKKAHSKITHTINKAETCKNYNCWCGKLERFSNCETCEFYEIK